MMFILKRGIVSELVKAASKFLLLGKTSLNEFGGMTFKWYMKQYLGISSGKLQK